MPHSKGWAAQRFVSGVWDKVLKRKENYKQKIKKGGWKPPKLTKQEMKMYLKRKQESYKREDEELDRQWRKDCEETSVRD